MFRRECKIALESECENSTIDYLVKEEQCDDCSDQKSEIIRKSTRHDKEMIN